MKSNNVDSATRRKAIERAYENKRKIAKDLAAIKNIAEALRQQQIAGLSV